MKDGQAQVPSQLRMTREVFDHISETIGKMKAEQGGILGGDRSTGEVTHYCFDEAASEHSGVAYTPNNKFLNSVIKQEWRPKGIDYLGSIHSHPPFCKRPSSGDEYYAKRILEILELPYLLTPIVTTIADTGSFSLFPYAAVDDGSGIRIVEQELYVGGKPVDCKERKPLRIPKPDAIPWEVLVCLGGVGLATAGIATAQLIRDFKRYRKIEEGETKGD